MPDPVIIVVVTSMVTLSVPGLNFPKSLVQFFAFAIRHLLVAFVNCRLGGSQDAYWNDHECGPSVHSRDHDERRGAVHTISVAANQLPLISQTLWTSVVGV